VAGGQPPSYPPVSLGQRIVLLPCSAVNSRLAGRKNFLRVPIRNQESNQAYHQAEMAGLLMFCDYYLDLFKFFLLKEIHSN
jgi:hypothetical protein